MKQSRMFETEDLPLFSGTSPQVQEPQPLSNATAHTQLGMFNCPVCRDTGRIDGEFCTCDAGCDREQKTLDYEAKREANADRLEARAAKARQEAQQRSNAAHAISDHIPLGQPILVGHHSEKRARRDADKIWNNHAKAYELSKQADNLERRAEAARKNKAIFSDDPNADEKIQAKIERLEARQEQMKAANKLIRKDDRAGLLDMGFSERLVNDLLTPDYMGNKGFASWALTNNGANIRRLKQRLQEIEKRAADETTEQEINGITIIDNVEDNRVQIFFPGKPDAETRKKLKSNGFRWAPSVGAWQRHRSDWAMHYAEQIVNN